MTMIPYTHMYYQFYLQDTINYNLKAVTQERFDNGPEETFIDFRKDPNGELKIKVRDLRKNKMFDFMNYRVKKHDKKHPNILRIFVDTVSRNDFQRKFKKTAKFLKEYNFVNKEKYRAYQFFRFHSIQDFTFPNLFASSYGRNFKQWNKHKLKRIQTHAAEKGYVTGLSSDCCVVAETETKSK